MSQKQSTSACTHIHIHSEIGKGNKFHISKLYNLLIFAIKPPQKGWNDDENETLHWIMRWGWMRWKQNLALNNDDGKKLYIKYLHKKLNKKFHYYPPYPLLSLSLLRCLKIEIK